MKIDRTSIDIIRHLKDGRKSFAQIARELDVAENTVRSRVNRLIDEGVLDISGGDQSRGPSPPSGGDGRRQAGYHGPD